jgi:hypothetical protein
LLPRDIAPTRRSHARHCSAVPRGWRALCREQLRRRSHCRAAKTQQRRTLQRCAEQATFDIGGPARGRRRRRQPGTTLAYRLCAQRDSHFGWVPSGIPTSAGFQVGFPLRLGSKWDSHFGRVPSGIPTHDRRASRGRGRCAAGGTSAALGDQAVRLRAARRGLAAAAEASMPIGSAAAARPAAERAAPRPVPGRSA